MMTYKQIEDKLRELEARILTLELIHKYAIQPRGCSRCGLGSDGQPMGYVCNDPLCPTHISCLNTQDIFK